MFDELNNLVMVDGTAELAQRLGLAIRIRAGEWFLDRTLGIPWFELLGNKGAELRIQREIRRVLLEDAAVRTVNSINLTPLPERTMTVEFEVTLTDDTQYKQTVEV
ncbi:MAG TPA: hypothetical protein VHY08_11640 [Bacillota bacterium]|nr:hypothetical protein [Bacillota bacterium]